MLVEAKLIDKGLNILPLPVYIFKPLRGRIFGKPE
jgi:hypothetical protein